MRTMRNILIVSAREIREKKLLLMLAVFCAVLVLVSPLTPGWNDPPVTVMSTAAFWIAPVLLIGTALFLGIGVINGDLQEGRLGFYLARPLSTGAIWAGKTLAVLALALLMAFLVIVIPTILGGGLFALPMIREMGQPVIAALALAPDVDVLTAGQTYAVLEYLSGAVLSTPVWLALLTMLLVVAIGQFLGLGLRTRSAWLVLDLLVLGTASFLIYLAIEPFLRNEAYPSVVAMMFWSLVVVAMSLLTAHYRGLGSGRSDLHRTHRATSLAALLLLISGSLVILGFSYARRSGATTELVDYGVVASADGTSWIAIAGSEQSGRYGFWRSHLIHVESGESIELQHTLPLISPDGRTVLLLERESFRPEVHLKLIDLSAPAQVKETNILIPMPSRLHQDGFFSSWPHVRMSESGSLVAWVDELQSAVAVFDLRKERMVVTRRLQDGWGTLHILELNDSEVLVRDWGAGDGNEIVVDGVRYARIDLRTGEVFATVRMPFRDGVELDPESGTVLGRYRENEVPMIEIRDASTGEIIEKRQEEERSSNLWKLESDPPAISSTAGPESRRIPLPEEEGPVAVRELGDPHLAIFFTGSGTTWIVDWQKGTLQRLASEVELVAPDEISWHGDHRMRGVGYLSGDLIRRIAKRGEQLVLLDPETLEVRPLTR